MSGGRSGRLTVRVRLTLWYGLMFFVGGAVLVGVTYLLVGRSLDANLSGGFEVTAVSPNPAGEPAAEPTHPSDEGEAIPIIRIDGEPEDAADLPDVLASKSEEARAATMQDLVTYSALALGAAGLAALAGGWLMAGRALRPLHQVTATARRVAESNLHERITLAGPRDEITELADTFDGMLERLDRAFDGQRRFVANASHELRTPLAVNRGLIELAASDPSADDRLRDLADRLLEVNGREQRLIEALLVLTRAENRVTDSAPVDLAALTDQVVEETRGEAESARVAVRRSGPTVTVDGDRVLLEQLIANLVRNGVRHNRADGWVRIITRATPSGAELVVTNSGPAVAAEDLPSLFEPFRRAGAERTYGSDGSGLGLSIVRSVTEAHGGTVHAEPGAAGGLVVHVHLPAAPE